MKHERIDKILGRGFARPNARAALVMAARAGDEQRVASLRNISADAVIRVCGGRPGGAYARAAR